MQEPLVEVFSEIITRLRGTGEHPGLLHAAEAIAGRLEHLGVSASEIANRLAEADALALIKDLDIERSASRRVESRIVAKWHNRLTMLERRELRNYTNGGHLELNAALRDATVTDSQQKRIDAINRALTKLPRAEGVVVYRTARLPLSVIRKYKVGCVVTHDDFTSSTTSELVAASFYGNVRFNIYSRYGRLIEEYSGWPDQKEVIFPLKEGFLTLQNRAMPDHLGSYEFKPTQIDLLDLGKAA